MVTKIVLKTSYASLANQESILEPKKKKKEGEMPRA